MPRFLCFLGAAGLCLALVPAVKAATVVMTDFSTTPAWVVSGTEAHVLDSFTAGDTYSDFTLATVNNAISGTILHGVNGSAPASQNEALSDDRVDTGVLSTGASTLFEVAPSSAQDKFFLIFDGSDSFFQGPETVFAVDGSGAALGSVNVNTSNDLVNDAIMAGDFIVEGDIARVGNSTLSGREMYGLTIDIADFGVSNLSAIAGFTITGETEPAAFASANTLDVHVVGIAGIPEPASLVLLVLGMFGLAASRRKA